MFLIFPWIANIGLTKINTSQGGSGIGGDTILIDKGHTDVPLLHF
jgi:hypothetical protein